MGKDFAHCLVASTLVLAILAVAGFGQTQKEKRFPTRWTGNGYALCASCNPPKSMSWRSTLTLKSEPGEPMVVSGTVYKEDGVTPAPEIVLFVYQTDAGGYYHRPKEDVFDPKIWGFLRTGKDGRYEFRTIKPAPEVLGPHGPAHIHVHIYGEGIPEYFPHEYWFEGDPRIKPEMAEELGKLGRFSPIIHLVKDTDGV